VENSAKQPNSLFRIPLALATLLILLLGATAFGQEPERSTTWSKIDQLSSAVAPRVITWRRDIHQHPELGNREFRTAQLVADHLRRLGFEVKTGVAHTGVVGVLQGKKPGPVVALRADMDALPVKEALDLPFASKVKATYNGQEVSVMHACGHDAHTAVLLGVAEVLSALREQLPGTVKFIFQPAEDSKPDGEEGGAELMIREGVLENPKANVIFGLHVLPYPSGTIGYRPGGLMAAVDNFRIMVRGRQTHGALPWGGVDPIPVASQIILGLQTIVSRQIDLTAAPAVVTVGTIHGGSQTNIVPNEVEMSGTIRTFDPTMRKEIHKRIQSTATMIAQSAGATAEVTIFAGAAPVTFNDPSLTQRMGPVLEKVAGKGKALIVPPITAGEDFSFYQQQIPGLFFFLGIAPKDVDPSKVAMNHSPYFYVDESSLIVGVRALAHLTFAYTEGL